MRDRSPEMIAFVGGQLSRMRREGRKASTNPGEELRALLTGRWPDMSPFELLRVVAGLGEAIQETERLARPANSNERP